MASLISQPARNMWQIRNCVKKNYQILDSLPRSKFGLRSRNIRTLLGVCNNKWCSTNRFYSSNFPCNKHQFSFDVSCSTSPMKPNFLSRNYNKISEQTSSSAAQRRSPTLPLSEVFSDENKCKISERLQPNKKLVGMASKFKKDDKKKSAILVPLCTVNGEPSILFTLRSHEMFSHHGEVSFPGGRIDPTDDNKVSAALREYEEELGLSADNIDILGDLTPTLDRSLRLVYPVIGYVGEFDERQLNISPKEISLKKSPLLTSLATSARVIYTILFKGLVQRSSMSILYETGLQKKQNGEDSFENLIPVEYVFTLSIEHLCNPSNQFYTYFEPPKTNTHIKTPYVMPVFLSNYSRIWGITAIFLNQALMAIIPEHYTSKTVQVMKETKMMKSWKEQIIM